MGKVFLMSYVYRNAKYINAEGTRIDCELDLDIETDWTPYTLDISDTDMTINNEVLLEQMKENNDIAPYVPPEPPTQEEIDAENALLIRERRKMLLITLVDPVVSNPLRWSELTELQQSEVQQYRLDLLAITDQETFPTSVSWPTTPTILDS